jgi:uncharacterized protein
MELKRLSFALEVKADDDARTIEGFASVFNNVDSYSDIVMPGAFTKSLSKRTPVMLWQHNSDQPIGVWDDFMEQEKGLFIKGTVLPTQLGNDAYTLAKAKAIKGMSIGYSPIKWEMDDKKGVRKLSEVDLWEVSLVTFPANEKAQITRVKSEDGSFMSERDFEEFLRDAGGLSHREAKTVIADGYKALLKHRDGGADEQTVLRDLRDVLTSFRI